MDEAAEVSQEEAAPGGGPGSDSDATACRSQGPRPPPAGRSVTRLRGPARCPPAGPEAVSLCGSPHWRAKCRHHPQKVLETQHLTSLGYTAPHSPLVGGHHSPWGQQRRPSAARPLLIRLGPHGACPSPGRPPWGAMGGSALVPRPPLVQEPLAGGEVGRVTPRARPPRGTLEA